MKKTLILAVLLAGFFSASAQVTTSSVQGVITKAAGGTVIATHVPTETVYNGSVNASGSFTISNMRVGGPYKIEITKTGEQPMVYEDVYLELGQPFVLNPNQNKDLKTKLMIY